MHSDNMSSTALMRQNGETGATAQEYCPSRLLDRIMLLYNLKCDSDLARMFEVHRSVISKIRHKKRKISAELLLDIHETTNIGIGELRNIMGDTNEKYFSLKRSPGPS